MFDIHDPADLAALKSEVNTDPQGYGYIPADTNTGVLEIINLKRTSITVSKPKISSASVRSGTTYEAYNNLSIDEQEWIRWMTGSNGFEEENLIVTADVRQQLAGDPSASGSIWAPANRDDMNAAMLALIDVDGSRAEELFGYGTVISRNDWIAARDS